MQNSKIEWTDSTWNPLRGCSRVSEGCRNCYAEKIAGRFSSAGQPFEGVAELKFSNATKGGDGKFHGRWTGNIEFIEKHLEDPLRWRKPQRIFVNSMSDLFHENVKDEWIDEIFAVMGACEDAERGHTFQILTKRPARMVEYMRTRAHKAWNSRRLGRSAFPPRNVWLGVSVENQQTADERIPLLLQAPAVVRFLSCEPLLGAVLLPPFCGDPYHRHSGSCSIYARINWVIAGGESGHGARPVHPDWIRGLRDQCKASGVPFFFKQWGEYAPVSGQIISSAGVQPFDGAMSRVGKKNAGRMLDGRTWEEMPELA
jgi:protein gp37